MIDVLPIEQLYSTFATFYDENMRGDLNFKAPYATTIRIPRTSQIIEHCFMLFGMIHERTRFGRRVLTEAGHLGQ